MITRYPVICPVCGKITLVRVQAGYLDRHAIRFNCGNCNITIRGEYENGGADFPDCKLSDNDKCADYVIQSSGELLTHALRKVSSFEDTIVPSPFLNSTMLISEDNYDLFRKRMNNCLGYKAQRSSYNDWVHELYFNGKTKYLREQLDRINMNGLMKMHTQELVDIQKIHLLDIGLFKVLNDKEFENYSKMIFKQYDDFLNKDVARKSENLSKLKQLCEHFAKSNELLKWQKKIYQLNQLFTEKIDKFIPVIGLEFYELDERELEKDFAITTVSFEEVQSIYIHGYELLGDSLSLLAAYDNLFVRGDYQKMRVNGLKINKKGIKTLDDFEKIDSNGKRIPYFNGTDKFEKMIENIFKRNIRNSIGHYDYDISLKDPFKQTLVFYDRKKQINISLIGFCTEIVNLMVCMQKMNELVYQTQKWHLCLTNNLIF
ncbi:hypothetical protein [[Eubacterium] hominis]|uniref:hypothetical protein n=1 Tax=[Eubacterium] hominis TaxID=2764325 RepID=UPI003A4D4869